MNRIFGSIVILAAFCQPVFSQENGMEQTDSLLQDLRRSAADSFRVKTLFRLGDANAYHDIPLARKYYAQGYALSVQLDYYRGIIRYYSSDGEVLNMLGQYDSCMLLLRKGVELSIRRGDRLRSGIMYQNMGNTFGLMEKLDSAAAYYYRSLAVFEFFGDTDKIATVYNNLSSIFTRTDQQEKALRYADSALRITSGHKDGFYLSNLLNKSGILWKMRRYSESDQLNQEVYQLAGKEQDEDALRSVLKDFCSHSMERGEYQLLRQYARQFAVLEQKTGSQEDSIEASYWLGAAAFYLKDMKAAALALQSAIQKAAAGRYPARMKECYELYSRILLVNGDVRAADRYAAIADSIEEHTMGQRVLRMVHDAEVRYQTEKKEAQLHEQARDLAESRKRILVLSALLLLLTFAAIMTFAWMRNRQRLLRQEKALRDATIKQLEQEKALAATQSVVKGQEEERSRLAKDLHDGLGGILSSTKYSFNTMKENFILPEAMATAFERSMSLLDVSIAELRRVAHNMMPETLVKLTLGEALRDYCEQVTQSGALTIQYQEVGMDKVIADNTIKIGVYRVVQELVTNVIRHAATDKALVQVIAADHSLHLTVEDDGAGFDPAALKGDGAGIRNVRNRVEFLGGKIEMDASPGKGTSVYIEIPMHS